MMNSDNNDTNDQPSDPPDQSEGEMNGSLPPKRIRGDGQPEHAKPKRRGRRGKKRKQRNTSGGAAAAPCSSEQHEECASDHPADCEKHSLSWDSEEEDIEVEDFHQFSNVMIRPVDVPKAPENSTQFIIDDHDECRLYMSFETPNPYLADYLRCTDNNLLDGPIVEPDGVDEAYVDINYEYESPHDFDNSAYYDREFELSYNSNRFDELLRLSRNDLTSGIKNFENQYKSLNQQLEVEDPDPILEQLQSQLLELQEKYMTLTESNAELQERLKEAGVDHLSNEEEIESASLPYSDHLRTSKGNLSFEEANNENFADSSNENLEKEEKNPSPEENRLYNLNIDDDQEMEYQSINDQSTEDVIKENEDLTDISFEGRCNENLSADTNELMVEDHSSVENVNSNNYCSILGTDSVSQNSKDRNEKPDSEHVSNIYNQKQESESPRHMSLMDASNKENTCLGDVTFEERLVSPRCTPRHESCYPDSCSEHILVKEKAILRDSEAQRCEEIPLNAVSDEH